MICNDFAELVAHSLTKLKLQGFAEPLQTSFAENLQRISLSLSLSQGHPPIGVATPRAEGRAGRRCRSGVRRPFHRAAVGSAGRLTPGIGPQKGPPPTLLAPQIFFFSYG